jgi:Ser/Thr protein kinase RdoA (MazF antagonist)
VDQLQTIAQQFVQNNRVQNNRVRTVQPYGSGNVNDTFLVTLAQADPRIQSNRFILQRINQKVFPQPALILVNMLTFTDYMRQRLTRERQEAVRRWEVPLVLGVQQGANFLVDEEGHFWRAISLIEQAKTYPRIRDAAHAREAGYALGRFHSLISDLDPSQMHDTLPGFHITPQYLAHYDRVVAQRTQTSPDDGSSAIRDGMAFVAARREWANVLEEAKAQGKLMLRTMHGDPKVDNILIDDANGQAVSLIDLDTVKPGLVHYDVGDCLRSCCNPAGEETTALDSVTFDLALCRNILEGYLGQAARFFTANDYAYLFDAIRLITFELGLRFFTDHLAGNVYFKVKHPQHNLQRAQVQFRLVEEIEQRERAIREMIDELR